MEVLYRVLKKGAEGRGGTLPFPPRLRFRFLKSEAVESDGNAKISGI